MFALVRIDQGPVWYLNYAHRNCQKRVTQRMWCKHPGNAYLFDTPEQAQWHSDRHRQDCDPVFFVKGVEF